MSREGETRLTFPRARRQEQKDREGHRHRGRGGHHTAVSGTLTCIFPFKRLRESRLPLGQVNATSHRQLCTSEYV